MTLRARCLQALALLLGLILPSGAADTLFPRDIPSAEWKEFKAQGFSAPVAGMVFRTDHQPCCGVPLGGLGTWCLDLDTNGTFGFNNVFQCYPRRAKLFAPFLGFSTGGKTWVLATAGILKGGKLQGCIEPGTDPFDKHPDWSRSIPAQQGVVPAKEIHYFGHYPIADLQYDTDAPVNVALRAWSPFIPGDAKASNIPAALFEVQVNNPGSSAQQMTLAFSYPGPSEENASSKTLTRQNVQQGMTGVSVSAPKCNYTVAVLGEQRVRMGGGLSSRGDAWSAIASTLPVAQAEEAGASLAVDLKLEAGESKTVSFILSWYVPSFGLTTYYPTYAATYTDSKAVARDLASRADTLLARIIAWQQAIYTQESLPVWLRDSLVNNLCLIAEDSYWAQSKPPLDFAGANGLYGMMECPRACPQIECIPCSWYGNIPVLYFFPELALTTLRGYKQYQAANGAAPFLFGPRNEMYDSKHAWQNQIALNGVCYVDMVDRLWQMTGDRAVLEEFYDSVKRSTTLTMMIGEPPANVISMPPGDGQTEWWEGWPWTGMTPHVGGMHLSNLVIAERMAVAMKDAAFAAQCRAWLKQGQEAMEGQVWNKNSYLLMWNTNSGKRDDRIMANQLDAEWANAYHGLPGVFDPQRVTTVLETVKRFCMVDAGAVSFSSGDGKPELTTYGIFIPEIMILGMTYIYQKDRETGLDVVRRMMDGIVRRNLMGWDTPNMIRADTAARTFGTDYYQNMMLWALPTALEGRTLKDARAKGTLVEKVLKAGK
jgi:uncharacterized protein (DUF608 family)